MRSKIPTSSGCTVRILDEVFCLIGGVAPNHIKILVDRYSVFASNYIFHPKYKLGVWDGKLNFFKSEGMSYTYLLPEILQQLVAWKYKIELEDERDNVKPLRFINKDEFSHIKFEKTGAAFEMRPYQVEACNSVLEDGNGLIVAATSAGKTSICAGLSLPVVEVGGRVLIIVPSTSLVIQTIETLAMLGFNVGEYSGTKKDYGNDVIVSTWQSLKNNPKLIQTFQCLIVDEVHLAKGKVLNDLICTYAHKIPYRFGMTGTIPKAESDAMTIRVGLGDVKYVIPAHELQAQKYIADLNVNVMMLMEDDDEDMFPDYASERNFLSRNPDRIEWIADFIMMINDGGPKSNTFVLVSSIPMGNALQKLIPDSVFLNGKDDAIQRKKRYDQYEKENGLVTIATVQIAGTGLSVDRIYNLFYIDIGKSFVRVIQAIGRGLRKTFDKDHVEVYDITSSLKYSKRHLGQRKSFYEEAKYPFKLKKIKYRDNFSTSAKKVEDDTFTDVDILAVLGR